jgi:hypothetical protein
MKLPKKLNITDAFSRNLEELGVGAELKEIEVYRIEGSAGTLWKKYFFTAGTGKFHLDHNDLLDVTGQW